MGTGKTIQTLAAIRQTQALPALVVCPNSVKHHWYRETSKWLPESTPYVVSGSAAQRRKILAQAQEDPTAFVIINIESVRLHSRLSGYGSIRLSRCTECDPDYGDGNLTEAKCEVHPKELNQISFLTCVLDEAHRVKDPKAKQTRAIWSIFHAPSVKYAWALTGTPITKHPGDLWSTMHAVAPQDFPVKSKFIDRYAKTSFNPFGGMDIIGLKKESADELFAFLDSRFRRITKDRVLTDLPPKVYTTHTVEMSPKQKKAYDQLESQFATRLEDGSLLIARSHLSARTRLMQLASSYCEIDYGDDPTDIDQWTVIPTTPSSKIDALVFLVEDLHSQGKPAAVAAEHRQLIELAEQQLTKSGYQCVMITGDVPANVRSANLQQFQNGDANVILFTYKAGGVGLDMSTADTLIKLQLSWSMVDNLQGEDRIHRIGSEQHQSINIVHITTEGTIEEDQISSYEQKIERLEEITRDRKRREEAGLDTQRNDDEMTKIKAETLGE